MIPSLDVREYDIEWGVLFVMVVAGIFAFFATHVSVKGLSSHKLYNPPTYFTDANGYNFVYKKGFPATWETSYYRLPTPTEIATYNDYRATDCAIHELRCRKVRTPANSYLVYHTTDYTSLALDAVAAITGVAVLGVILRLFWL